MYKQAFVTTLILVGILFSQMSVKCFADVTAKLGQAKEYLQNGYYQQAEGLYKQIISSNPGTDYAFKAQKELIYLYYAMRKHQQRNVDVQPVIDKFIKDYSKHPSLAKALCDVARKCEREWDFVKAKALHSYIIEHYPGSTYAAKAQVGMSKSDALLFITTDRDALGQAAVDKMIADYADNEHIVDALSEIAYRYRWLKQYDNAIRLYQCVVDRWPNSADAMWAQMGVAKTNVEAHNFDAAAVATEKLLSDYPYTSDLATAIHYVARRYRKEKKYAEAKKLYRQIIQRYPNSKDADNGRLEIAKIDILSDIDRGNYSSAQGGVSKLTADFSDNPTLSVALVHIAWKFEEAGRYGDAVVIHNQIINGFSDNFRSGRAQLDLAKCQAYMLIDSSDDTAVMSKVDGVIADFADNPQLHKVVGKIAEYYSKKASELKDKGKSRACLQKAATIYEKLIQGVPGSLVIPQVYCNAGACYQKMGDYEKSNQCYQCVLDDYPWYRKLWHAQYMIGRNYEKMGEAAVISKTLARANTRAAYQQLVERYPDCKAAKSARRWLNKNGTNH